MWEATPRSAWDLRRLRCLGSIPAAIPPWGRAPHVEVGSLCILARAMKKMPMIKTELWREKRHEPRGALWVGRSEGCPWGR